MHPILFVSLEDKMDNDIFMSYDIILKIIYSRTLMRFAPKKTRLILLSHTSNMSAFSIPTSLEKFSAICVKKFITLIEEAHLLKNRVQY